MFRPFLSSPAGPSRSRGLSTEAQRPQRSPSPPAAAPSGPAPLGPRRPHPHPERVYTGPESGTLPDPRTRSQADKYFARVANENVQPSRWSKALGIGGWVLGGFACTYMVLYGDFGEREHVFSPVRRRFHRLTNELFTLSPSERRMMGLQDAMTGTRLEGDERSSV